MQEIQWKDINYALKEGMILMVVEDHTYVRMKEDRIFLHNENWHTWMDCADFCELYKKNHFVIYEDSQDLIDEKKDEEYYQWREKYQ